MSLVSGAADILRDRKAQASSATSAPSPTPSASQRQPSIHEIAIAPPPRPLPTEIPAVVHEPQTASFGSVSEDTFGHTHTSPNLDISLLLNPGSPTFNSPTDHTADDSSMSKWGGLYPGLATTRRTGNVRGVAGASTRDFPNAPHPPLNQAANNAFDDPSEFLHRLVV